MKRLILLIISSLIFSYSQAQTYTEQLALNAVERTQFKKLYDSSTNKDSVLTLAGKHMEHQLTDRQYHYWKGTVWDYNGYTNIPKQGEIACGYYVSTNLKHLGVKINRYRMAQQSSKNEVKTIDPSPKIYYGNHIDFIAYAKKNLEDGLYILGMTSHVGMLQKMGNDLYLLHSSPVGVNSVAKEHVDECEVLAWSDIFVIGKLSNNKAFVKKWLNGSTVNVVMD